MNSGWRFFVLFVLYSQTYAEKFAEEDDQKIVLAADGQTQQLSDQTSKEETINHDDETDSADRHSDVKQESKPPEVDGFSIDARLYDHSDLSQEKLGGKSIEQVATECSRLVRCVGFIWNGNPANHYYLVSKKWKASTRKRQAGWFFYNKIGNGYVPPAPGPDDNETEDELAGFKQQQEQYIKTLEKLVFKEGTQNGQLPSNIKELILAEAQLAYVAEDTPSDAIQKICDRIKEKIKSRIKVRKDIQNNLDWQVAGALDNYPAVAATMCPGMLMYFSVSNLKFKVWATGCSKEALE